MNMTQQVAIAGLACEFGDLKCAPTDIDHFASQCVAAGLEADLSQMGCGSYWKMTQPLAVYIKKAVTQSLAKCDMAAAQIDRVIFSTSDDNLRAFSRATIGELLTSLGLSNAIPMIVSLQQCASSLAALDVGKNLLLGDNVTNVLVINFDFAVTDANRITAFALFGDAVVSYILSVNPISSLTVGHYAVAVDYAGLSGADDFGSRVAIAKKVYSEVLGQSGINAADIHQYFSTNTYRPVATMSAAMSGVDRKKLNIVTLAERGHCGICDWAINLSHYLDNNDLVAGQQFAVQATAPGFFACTILQAR